MRNWINVERAKRKMTQAELANKLNVSRHSINAIESERYMPSAEVSMRIARYFNVKMEDIFFLEDEEFYMNKPEKTDPLPLKQVRHKRKEK